ncbi:tetratricopeptide repeat protein [Aureispira anguillae]|uniref:tetratricopeptide repeat protein n=1 Tax=Aureispira anguillae TaxID=2864201 RepID=UPI002230705F|nr:tetratricopeptide repeat protein [Aureispira anguillae]
MLEEKLQNAPKDSIAELHFLIAKEALFGIPKLDKVSSHANQLYVLSKEVQDKRGMARSMDLMAEVALRKGDLNKVVECAQQLDTLARVLKDSQTLSKSFDFLADVFLNQGKVKEATQQYYKILNLLLPQKNYEYIGYYYFKIAMIFVQTQQLDSAEVYYNKIYDLPCQGTLGIKTKENAAITKIHQNNYIAALKFAQKALACARDIEDTRHEIEVLNLIGKLLSTIGNYEEAMPYLVEALNKNIKSVDSLNIGLSYVALAMVNQKLENYPTAIEQFNLGIEIGKKIFKDPKTYLGEDLGTWYGNLGALYQKMNKTDSALLYYNKSTDWLYQKQDQHGIASTLSQVASLLVEQMGAYNRGLDSLDRAEAFIDLNENSGPVLFAIYITKGHAYEGLNKNAQALTYFQKAEALAKKLQSNVELEAIYKAMADFYSQQKNYKEAYAYQVLANAIHEKYLSEEKQMEMVSLQIKYESEKLKRENLELEKNNELQQQELAFNAQLNTRNRYIILGLILLILLLIGIGTLIYRQKNLQTEFKIMRLEQKALKAQINPHFFFNVLNSLQGTILSEEPMVAYKYHTKFTKLMRLILMQSDQEGIALNEEIEALRLYLELEQLRTGAAFDFEIVNDLEGDDKAIVPSMLLQPFVENAIWHGVMNREEGEEKKIIIRIKGKGERIVCEIEDTGVGRKQAELIKQQKSNKHESMGMKVTQNRLELFQLRYKMPLNFGIQDVLDPQGKIFGTKVKVEIPTI